MHVAVVGAGLIGSAAARHLAKAGHRVTLIGPGEPENQATHQAAFGSHYDEGRITRQLDPDPFWARVSQAAIARYPEIAAESGVEFFTVTGAVMAGPEGGDFVARTAAQRASDGIPSDALMGPDLAARFPFFRFEEGTTAFHETDAAGHVSPRSLVRAQTLAAAKHGAEVIRCEALSVRQLQGRVRVETRGGEVAADRAIVAAGAYSDKLLGGGFGYSVYARSIAFFRLSPDEAARLAAMPSVVLRFRDGRDPYILPPIRYPDGSVYLKIGGDPVDRRLSGAGEIGDWFRSGGDPEVGRWLEATLRELMPGLQPEAVTYGACVTTFVDEDRPILGEVAPGITLAGPGCGRGAKCSDELGRLAALVATGDGAVAERLLALPKSAAAPRVPAGTI